jgi:hypothetical protein
VLHDDPDHPFSEAVGVVMAVDEASKSVSLMTKKGELSIALADLVAAKVFGAR